MNRHRMAIVDFPRAAAALEWLSPLSMASLFFFPFARVDSSATSSGPTNDDTLALWSPIGRL